MKLSYYKWLTGATFLGYGLLIVSISSCKIDKTIPGWSVNPCGSELVFLLMMVVGLAFLVWSFWTGYIISNKLVTKQTGWYELLSLFLTMILGIVIYVTIQLAIMLLLGAFFAGKTEDRTIDFYSADGEGDKKVYFYHYSDNRLEASNLSYYKLSNAKKVLSINSKNDVISNNEHLVYAVDLQSQDLVEINLLSKDVRKTGVRVEEPSNYVECSGCYEGDKIYGVFFDGKLFMIGFDSLIIVDASNFKSEVFSLPEDLNSPAINHIDSSQIVMHPTAHGEVSIPGKLFIFDLNAKQWRRAIIGNDQVSDRYFRLNPKAQLIAYLATSSTPIVDPMDLPSSCREAGGGWLIHPNGRGDYGTQRIFNRLEVYDIRQGLIVGSYNIPASGQLCSATSDAPVIYGWSSDKIVVFYTEGNVGDSGVPQSFFQWDIETGGISTSSNPKILHNLPTRDLLNI